MKKSARVELSLPPSRSADVQAQGYRTVFEIGTGGMATVYIAAETGSSGLRRTVALKIMHEHLSRNERFRKRFLDEARVLTHITHPYVCRVFGFGEEGGRPFMTMEYLVGEPLSRVLRALRRRVDGITNAQRARLFARVIADVAEGLHAAHEATDARGRPLGVVHRDISPQNLFLLYDGTVRVLDFGIARYRDRYVETATNGPLTGKLPYMAPEQILGTAYDRRADLWALGVVFWELLTLTHLFRRESEARTLEAVCSAAIALPTKLVEGLPAGLDEIVNRTLQRDPELRYATGRELAQDLELWLSRSGRPVTHADVCEFLGEAFPGSYAERRRWAELAAPEAGPTYVVAAQQSAEVEVVKQSAEVDVVNLSAERAVAQNQSAEIDFASEALALASEPGVASSRRNLHHELLEHDEVTTLYRGRTSVASSEQAVVPLPSVQAHAAPELEAAPLAALPLAPVAHPKTLESFNIAELDDDPAPRIEPATGLPVAGSPAGARSTVQRPAAAPAEIEIQVVAVAAPRGRSIPWRVLVGACVVVLAALGLYLRWSAGSLAGSLAASESTPGSPAQESVAATRARTFRFGSERLIAPAVFVGDVVVERAKSAPAKREPLPNTAPSKPLPLGPSPSSGDVLIVSTPAGVGVYLGERLLGKTPLKTRLPAGTVQFSVQLSAQGPRTPISAKVNAGQLNIVTLR